MAAVAVLSVPPAGRKSSRNHHHLAAAPATIAAVTALLRFAHNTARPDCGKAIHFSPPPQTLLKLTVPRFHTPVPICKRRRGSCRSRVMAAARKIARCPPLDRQAEKHHRLRFVRKLTTLLLSKPRHFLPLRILSRHCRHYLSLAGTRRSVLSMVLRYPAIFRLFHAPSHSSHSLFLLSVGLTPAAAALAAEESRLREEISSSLATKLQRLLMLSTHRRLLLSKIVHLAPDLGLPPDFRPRLCNRHPGRFRTVDTSYGRALELVAWDPAHAVPLPQRAAWSDDDPRRPIIDRPPKFKQLKLRRGLNLKRRHRDYLIKFQELPEISPFSSSYPEVVAATPKLAEKRACAVVREVLGMTVERRTLVDHLTHFRKDLGLPNKLRALLVRHPEMFYVSLKGERDSVFLVEGYDHRGRLLEKDELQAAKERLVKLVRQGKRMRRERRNSTAYDDDGGGIGNGDDDEEEDTDDDEEGDGEEEEEDGFEDLFVSGIGDDWEELGAGDIDGDGYVDDWEEEEEEKREFWTVKASSHRQGTGAEIGEQSVW